MVHSSTHGFTPHYIEERLHLQKTTEDRQFKRLTLTLDRPLNSPLASLTSILSTFCLSKKKERKKDTDSKRKNTWKCVYKKVAFFMSSLIQIQRYEQGVRRGENDKMC